MEGTVAEAVAEGTEGIGAEAVAEGTEGTVAEAVAEGTEDERAVLDISTSSPFCSRRQSHVCVFTAL